MRDTKVFSLSNNVELVKEICQYLNAEPGKLAVNHFADGEIMVELGETVRGKTVFFVQSTCCPVNESLMELLIAIDCAKRSSAGDIVAIIPYFGYARQDRKAKPRQPISARLVANLLTAAGANRVVTVDLHATQIQGFFDFPIDDLTAIPMMGQYFKNSSNDLENTVVVSPDHGGTVRARKLAELLYTPLAIVDKRRPRPNVCEAMGIIGDVKDKDVIVVDDICDTAGSLCAACNILRQNGAKKISVAISHGIFSGPALQRLNDSVIDEVVITNTIPLKPGSLEKCPKIKVLSLGLMLARIIEAISTHNSVSEVYRVFVEHED